MTSSDFEDRIRALVRVKGLIPRKSAPATEQPEPAQDRKPTKLVKRDIDDVIGDCGVYENGRRAARSGAAAGGPRGRARDHRLRLDRSAAADRRTRSPRSPSEFRPPAAGGRGRRPGPPAAEARDATATCVFVVLKPVRYVDHDEIVDVSEIAMFIGPNFVVVGAPRRERRACAGSAPSSTQATATCSQHGPTAPCSTGRPTSSSTATRTSSRYIDEDVDEIESAGLRRRRRTTTPSASTSSSARSPSSAGRCCPLGAPLQRLVEGTVPGIAPSGRAVLPRRARPPAARGRRDRGPRPAADRRPAGRPVRAPAGRSRAPERDRGAAERGHAQDLGVGRDRPGADRHRRHLRHELRAHARARLAVRLLRRRSA